MIDMSLYVMIFDACISITWAVGVDCALEISSFWAPNAVLWNCNYLLRFWFRFQFWILKSFGSGSGSNFWKVMVPVPVPVPTFEKVAMSSSGSVTVINYGSGSGSDFLTSYGSGSGSTSQKVTVPTVPVPVPVPQHCPNGTRLLARCHFTGPKKLSISRAKSPPTCSRNGSARIKNITHGAV